MFRGSSLVMGKEWEHNDQMRERGKSKPAFFFTLVLVEK